MIRLIKKMVEIAKITGCSHLASSLSCLPILKTIYDSKQPEDLVILSKGHGSLGLYAILLERGLNPNIKLCHPNLDIENGIECSTGSLGHGLPIGVGIAYAKKIKEEKGIVNVIIGDGECQEGSIWEALNLAEQFNLKNLKVYIDCNEWQATSKTVNKAHLNLAYMFPQFIFLEFNIKGQGLSIFKNHPELHSFIVNDKNYDNLIGELNEILSRK